MSDLAAFLPPASLNSGLAVPDARDAGGPHSPVSAWVWSRARERRSQRDPVTR